MVDTSAEELDAVVEVVRDVDVVQGGAGADTAEGETVDLVVLTNDGATVPDTDVLHDAGVVRLKSFQQL